MNDAGAKRARHVNAAAMYKGRKYNLSAVTAVQVCLPVHVPVLSFAQWMHLSCRIFPVIFFSFPGSVRKLLQSGKRADPAIGALAPPAAV